MLLLAGPVRGLVVDHKWVMYSLFLGTTLGGVPVVRDLTVTLDWRSALGAVVGLVVMGVVARSPAATGAAEGPQIAILFLSGLAACAAMLLPGLSGSYLLVLTGQYVPVLGAIEGITDVLTGSASPPGPAVLASASVLAPFAAGCLAALAGMSRLIRFLLHRHRSLMVGFLLTLLTGAVVGLWPFPTDAPTIGQAAGCIALMSVALFATIRISRLAPPMPGSRLP